MGAAAAGLTWSKGHIRFLQNTECIHGGPHLWVYLLDARARDLSHRALAWPETPPHTTPGPLLFSLKRGHPSQRSAPALPKAHGPLIGLKEALEKAHHLGIMRTQT